MKVYVLQEDNGYEGLGTCHGVFSSKAKALAYQRQLSDYSVAIFEINLDPVFIPKSKFPEKHTPYVKTGGINDLLYVKHPDYSFTKLLDLMQKSNLKDEQFSWDIKERSK